MKKIFVAGHNGMVGRAICSQLKSDKNIQIIKKNRDKLNLINQQNVLDFFKNEKPDEVIIAAAKVGGIYANNSYPAQFIFENLQIQNNIIHSAHLNDVQKILFLGSSCIYPKYSTQPIKENELLTGVLEPTNEPYAIAKIAGIKMCESYNRQYARDYRAAMPTNLYGPYDNYHPENSHVVPALIRRIHEAKIERIQTVVVWGTGKPMREFLFVEDMAEASLYIHNLDIKTYQNNTSLMVSHINIGTGVDVSIRELAETVKDVLKYDGQLIFDTTKPDGTPRKLMNVNLLSKLGWKAKTNLVQGLERSYRSFLKNHTY